MDQKDKALKTALTAVGILAFAMFAYYWVAWHTRKTENDVNFSEKADAPAPQDKTASEFAGVYSAAEPVEGNGHRLAFISLNRRDDGAGYFGTAKVDPIGSETESPTFFKCNDVNIADKDFFVKCNDPQLGQISFTGEWSKPSGAVQVTGTLLWTKDGNEIANKPTTLNRTGG